MKNPRFSLWLAAAFLAGGVASWLLTVPPAWAGKAPARVTWDYQCFAKTQGIKDGALSVELMKLGRDGWELVTVDPEGIYCMKQPK